MKTNQTVEGLVAAVMLGLVANATAMPSKQEISKAQPLVAELMAPAMDDYKAKKKTAAEVADAAVAFAAEAETEAAKFMLYRSSIPYYVRGEAYDKAAEAVTLLKTSVKDVPAEVVAEIISKATVRANREKAPQLFELYRQAKTQATAEKDVKELRKKPASSANNQKLAEALATAGDWPEALKEFANLRTDAALIAKKEQDGSGKSYELGEFWWTYTPAYENAEDTFKIHAVTHYRKALAAGEIPGLKKRIVEQRIKEYVSVASCASAGLGKEKQICRGGSKFLAHRWSFSKDFVDSIGKEGANVRGSVGLDNGQCVLQGGFVGTGKTGSPFTIELWYTEMPHDSQSENWILRADGGLQIREGETERGCHRYKIEWESYSRMYPLLNIQANHKAYIALTYDGQTMTVYATDTDGDNQLQQLSTTPSPAIQKAISLDDFHLFLGSVGDKGWGKFDEVRIWRVCMSKPEIMRSIKTGPDEVPTVGGSVTAASAATPSKGLINLTTSDRSPFAIKGNEATLTLKSGAKIDFVKCPAGKYRMGFNEGKNCLKLHSVTISRPFWMAKLPVTYRQADGIVGKVNRRECEKGKPSFKLDVLGGDNTPAALSYNQALEVLKRLNQECQPHLPQGYVFRMPSEAEYEYAARSGRSDYDIKRDGKNEITHFKDRLRALRDKGFDAVDWEKFPWRVPYFAAGSKKANNWGLYDMFTAGWAYVMDSVNCKGETDVEALTPYYADGSVDPVQFENGEGKHLMGVVHGCGWGCSEVKYRDSDWVKFLVERGDAPHDDCFLRLVVGPDLVSEWKAKNAKK